MQNARRALPWLLCVCLIGLLLPAASYAQATPPTTYDVGEPAPSRGLGGIIVGSVALGLAALNLATLPVCSMDSYPDNARDLCRGMSFTFAGIGGVVALIALPIGFTRNARYRAWRERNAGAAALLDMKVSGDPRGASLRYQLQF